MAELVEGFYNLRSPRDSEPVLVHGYNYQGEFIFGFNLHDGGGAVPLKELAADTRIVRVKIIES